MLNCLLLFCFVLIVACFVYVLTFACVLCVGIFALRCIRLYRPRPRVLDGIEATEERETSKHLKLRIKAEDYHRISAVG